MIRDIQGILHQVFFEEIAKDASHDICRLKTKPIYNRGAFGPGELRTDKPGFPIDFLAEEFPGHALGISVPSDVSGNPYRLPPAQAKDLSISSG